MLSIYVLSDIILYHYHYSIHSELACDCPLPMLNNIVPNEGEILKLHEHTPHAVPGLCSEIKYNTEINKFICSLTHLQQTIVTLYVIALEHTYIHLYNGRPEVTDLVLQQLTQSINALVNCTAKEPAPIIHTS